MHVMLLFEQREKTTGGSFRPHPFSLDLSPLTDESIEQTHRTSSAFVSHQVLITVAAGFRHSFHADCLSERPLAI